MKKSRSDRTKELNLELASVPTLEAVEKAIGLKAIKWKYRCHEIVCKMLTAKIAVGVERYGHFRGFVSRKYSRYGSLFHPHGWIETPLGRVIDPTRWVFRMVEPYIFYGPATDYDAGGQHANLLKIGSYPAGPHDPAEGSPNMVPAQRELRTRVIQLIMSKAAMRRLSIQTNGQNQDFSFDQVFWIAHAPIPWWGKYAPDIYKAIVDAGYKVLIPFDNWRMVMNENMASNLP